MTEDAIHVVAVIDGWKCVLFVALMLRLRMCVVILVMMLWIDRL